MGEFVELAYQTGDDVSAYYLQLYNGNNGRTYSRALTVGGDGTAGTDDTLGGLSFVYFDIAGIRHNLSGNGFALVDGLTGAVIEFISYDGTFVGTNGPAIGLTSMDIGVSERDGSGASNLSLQLGGSGCKRSDFAWQTVQVSTKGSLNVGQSGMCASVEQVVSAAPLALQTLPSTVPSVAPSMVPSTMPSMAPSLALVSNWICEV